MGFEEERTLAYSYFDHHCRLLLVCDLITPGVGSLSGSILHAVAIAVYFIECFLVHKENWSLDDWAIISDHWFIDHV